MRLKPEVIKHRIAAFERRLGKPYLYLAYHAALPMSLTPDLLYRIWANFKEDNQGNALEIPFHAVADVLISPLCELVGYELYEMDLEVREELLRQLQAEPKFGKTRIAELAAFLLAYIEPLLASEDEDVKALAQIQHWTALAYSKPKAATTQIAKAFAENQQPDKADLVWMESIVTALESPLGRNSKLLQYARGMGSYGRNELENAAEQLMEIGQWGENVMVSGVSLPIPDQIRHSTAWKRRRFLKQTLLTILGCGGVVGGYLIYKQIALKVFPCQVVTVDAQGEITDKKTYWIKYFTEQLGDSGVELDMVEIPGGNFIMGTEDEEIERLNQKYNVKWFSAEQPQHKVNVSSFFMGKFQVTQAQWGAIASRSDLKVERDLKPSPSRFKGDNRPVEQVSWYDAVEFCARLSNLTGWEYRLPSEAEWEYACRASTTTPFHFGETITDKLANYDASETYANEPPGEYRRETTPVGSFPPNAFGLYDLHGNVWEWCADAWHDNYEGAPTDGSAWSQGGDENRSPLRGGSWGDNPYICRSACRVNDDRRDVRNLLYGFRVVCGAGRT